MLHLNRLLLRPRQLFEKRRALANHLLHQLRRQPRLAQIQEAHVEQRVAQVLQELRLRRGIACARERQYRNRSEGFHHFFAFLLFFGAFFGFSELCLLFPLQALCQLWWVAIPGEQGRGGGRRRR